MLTVADFFDLTDFRQAAALPKDTWVWATLQGLKDYLAYKTAGIAQQIEGQLGDTVRLHGDGIIIEPGATIEDGVVIHGPAIIGAGTRVRHGAYIRGHVLTGYNCVIGHATEVKHSVFLNEVQVPHLSYVGDSILGSRVHLGAGTILSNLNINSTRDSSGKRPSFHVSLAGKKIDTGMEKMGCILGDGVETGCNTVINPGCLIGPDTRIYPGVSLRPGFTPGGRIIKLRQTLETVEVRPPVR